MKLYIVCLPPCARQIVSQCSGWRGGRIYLQIRTVFPRMVPIYLRLHGPMGENLFSQSEKRNPMKIPVWLKPGIWGAVLGAILMAIVGFSQLGWRTASSADALASERASDAVVAAMVPFCVAKAQSDTDQGAIAKFNAEQSAYSRVDLVINAGWATVGAAKTADNALAQACSMKPFSMKSG